MNSWRDVLSGIRMLASAGVYDDYVRDEFRSHDDWGPEVVQEGYYLVMGDHRNVSSDSRDWGQVPKKYIIGRVNVRWWPIWDVRIF